MTIKNNRWSNLCTEKIQFQSRISSIPKQQFLEKKTFGASYLPIAFAMEETDSNERQDAETTYYPP